MPVPKLNELDDLDRCALRVAWREVTTRSAPPRMSQAFMRRVLAFEIQAQTRGGCSKALTRELHKSPDAATTAAKALAGLKPGTRLLREWNGTTHVVDVSEDGFFWKGRTYRSLSVIARTITGAHWSGPRFFGIPKGAGA